MKELDALYETIKDRKENKEEGSYTTYLFEKGLEKILKKVGEECTEVVIASLTQTKQDQINEKMCIRDSCTIVHRRCKPMAQTSSKWQSRKSCRLMPMP